MKIASAWMVVLAVSLSSLPAAQITSPTNGQVALPPPTTYRMVEQGADHNVWQRETFEQAPDGKIVPKIHKYTELATGLNYQDDQGQWQPAQETIETYSGGAIARQGQYQVIFADNLNTEGAIDLQTPDKKRLRSNILGLGYYDHSSGQAVLIAQLQDSTGQLIASNQVLYPNAFEGVNADVRYTYGKGKFEQDVILREQPPAPEAYGLNAATTELEVMTEFLNPPAAKISGLRMAKGVQSEGEISWGAMTIGQGKAFDLGESKKLRSRVSVAKQYAILDGRQVLIEMVPVTAIQPSLKKLPAQSSTQRKLPFSVAKTRQLPKTPLARTSGQPMQLASLTPADKGYVLDYTAITANQTNYVFQGDTTYYISSAYLLSGVTTIEGGAVLKFSYLGSLDIDANGAIDCRTSAYHPAIFTSVNDNSVGEPFGSGSPSYNDINIFLDLAPTNMALHDLRFSYAYADIYQGYGWLDISDSQFFNTDFAVYGYNVGLHNVLVSRSEVVDAAVVAVGPSFMAENVTCDGGYALIEADDSGGTIALTNCLVTGQPLVSAAGFSITPLTNAVVCLPSPTVPVYQPMAGGFYYLTNNSPYRNVGTTNISPKLLADLAVKTTYPPVGYSNVTFATAMTFSPQAQRDNDGSPDLGYHYDPLDQLFVNSSTSSNLLFTTGTAAAWTTSEGLQLTAQVTATFAGTATSPNYWVRANVVQEQDGNGDYGAGGMVSWYSTGLSTAPNIWATFTRFSELAGYANPFRDENAFLAMNFNDCEFWTCGESGYGLGFYATNCLFERTYAGATCDCSSSIVFRNCTFQGRIMYIEHWSGTTWPVMIKDCAFDGMDLSDVDDPASGSYFDYNAFVTNSSRLPVLGTHDVVVTNFNWQSSWFGNFYLPSGSLAINAGNTTADQVGLYHFTTQVSQVKETNSVVDIGYHYVATDAYGNPVDTDGDGIPDYIEDANGNGVTDGGETPWAAPRIITGPVNQNVPIGSDVIFKVVAAWLPTLTYQWSYNGTPISGATSSTLELDNVQLSAIGTYSVTVLNSQGSASATAGLGVYDPGYYVPLAGNYTNYIFKSDVTYYVNSSIGLYGTTIMQGGAVIKYSNHATSQLVLNGPLTMQPAYRPTIFSSRDDNLAGVLINPSSGTPPTNSPVVYLVEASRQTNFYNNIRMLYAGIGIASTNAVDVTDGQFVNCGTVISNSAGGTVALHNVLITRATNCVAASGTVTAEFLTADQCQKFNALSNPGDALTNSILTAVANTTGVSLVDSVSLSSGAGVYLSAGGGNYYLATNSIYHDAGTVTVSSAALADIRRKTTRPPVVVTNTLFSSVMLAPLSLQDTNTPDLGYHYQVIDYLGSFNIYNGTLDLENGVVVAYNYSDWVVGGIGLRDGSQLVSRGLADHRNYLVYYSWLQEGIAPSWTVMPNPYQAYDEAIPINTEHTNLTVNPGIDLRFTSLMPSFCGYDYYDAGDWAVSHLSMFGCEVYNAGSIWGIYSTSTNAVYNLTNNLFVCPQFDCEAYGHVTTYNNLFVGTLPNASGYAFILNEYTNSWTNQDNAFDNCQAFMDGVIGYNAFLNGTVNYDAPATGDVVDNITWATGTLGYFYQPSGSSLVNAGNMTADKLGLYHFTTQTSQLKEANSVVDIGYHYVATDAYGNPLDSNGDDIPDYLEDANGNGIADPGESSSGITIETPSNGSVIY